jgi:YD repeat-containing protein
MSTVIAGNGLGLFNTSLSQLNGYGGQGNSRIGWGNDRAYINAATGNLVIQSQDDYLASLGLDVAMVRTYNSLGVFMDGDNGDNWQTSLYRQLLNLPSAGATTPITRIGSDGNQAIFTYDAAKGFWVGTDGTGAHDTLKLIGNEWMYEDTTNGVREFYDGSGRLLRSTDRDNKTLTYGYTGSLITSVVSASGESLFLDYTGTNLTQIRVVTASQTTTRVRYAYDAANRLTQVKVDLGNISDGVADDLDSDPNTRVFITNYEYSGPTGTRITRVSQSDGSELKIGYVLVNGEYRVASLQQLFEGGTYRTTTFNYDTENRRTDVYDGLGQVTQYFYDTQQRLTQVTLPPNETGALSILQYAYNAEGDIVQARTMVGAGQTRTVNFQYSNGNLIESRDDLGNTIRRTYNAADQIETETRYLVADPDGAGPLQPSGAQTTRYLYNAAQHLRFVITPEGRVTENRYNANGQVESTIRHAGTLYTNTTYTESALATWAGALTTKVLGERVDFTYDLRGQLATSKRYTSLTSTGTGNATGSATTTYVYNAAGQLLQAIDPRNATYSTTYTYDGMGRVLTTTDATGRISSSAYDDAQNRIVQTSDQVGTAYRLQTTSVYSKAGDLVSQALANSDNASLGTTTYAYDANGRLRMTTDATGQRSHWIYDEQGRKVGEISPEGVLTETVYNAAGQVIRTTRYAGKVDASTLVDGSNNPKNVTLAQLRGAAASVVGRPIADLNGAATGINYSATFVENGAPVAIVDPAALTLSDSNSANLTGATISVTNAQDVGTEVLLVDSVLAASYGITVTTAYSGSLSTLTLSGSATVAQYQAVLRTLRYSADAQEPVPGARNVVISVSDGDNQSVVATTTVTVVSANDAPVVDANGVGYVGNDYTLVYPSGGAIGTGGFEVGLLINVSDSDSATLTGAIINISGTGYANLTENLVIETAGTSITSSWASGTMTLSGTASVADYQTVLRTLKYRRLLGGLMSNSRTITITATDGSATSAPAIITVLPPGSTAPGLVIAPPAPQPAMVGPWAPLSFAGPATGITTAASISDPANRSRYVIYDAAGRTVFTLADDTEGLGASAASKLSVVETVYDGAGQVTKTIAYATRLATTVTLSESAIRSALVTDANNDRTTRFFYGTDGLLAGQLDADGYLIENLYDAGGRLQQVKRYSTATVLANRPSGSLTSLRPATVALLDQVTSRYYDAQGRVSGDLDAAGYLTTYAYDLANNKTGETRYSGATTYQAALSSVITAATTATPSGQPVSRSQSWTYDALSRVSTQTNAEGTVTSYNYDGVTGFLNSVTVASGTDPRVTTNKYDALGRVTQTMKGEGSAALAAAGGNSAAQMAAWNSYATKYDYDLAGRLLKTTDPNGNATLYYYNRDGQLRYTVRAGQVVSGAVQGEVTEFLYNAFNEVTSIIQYATRVAMSGLTGGVIASTLPGLAADATKDRKTDSVFSKRGLLIRTTDALGFVTDSEYTAFGQLLQRRTQQKLTATASLTTKIDTWTYDRTGDLKTSLRGSGGLAINESYVFDAFGRQTQKTDARGNLWQTNYDRLGRVIQTTDPLSGTIKTEYDAFSRTTKIYDQLNFATSFVYSDSARTITTTTPEGITTTRMRNRHGDEISVSLPNGGVTETTTFAYDKDGQITSKVDPAGNISRSEYDKAGLLKASIDANDIRIAYEYDPTNRVLKRIVDPTSYTTPTGTVINKANALNLVTSYTYNAFGDNATITDGNGVVTEMAYDLKGRQSAVIVDTAGLKIATVYAYDADANRLEVKEGILATGSAGNWNVSGTATRTTRYEYDTEGRRTRDVVDPLSLSLTTSYEYDKSGNLTRKRDAENYNTWYTYDAKNRLIYTVDALGGVTKNDYDAVGRVIATTRYANSELGNLVENPSGYGGSNAGWSGAGAGGTVIASSVGFDEPGFALVQSDRDAFYGGAFAVTAGEVFSFSADAIRSNSPYSFGIGFMLLINGSWTNWQRAASASMTGTGVQHLSGTFTIPSGATAVQVWTQIDGPFVQTGTWHFRNLQVIRQNQAQNQTLAWLDSATDRTAMISQRLVTELGRDRTTRSVYDADGRLTFSIDAAGAVTRYDYDDASRVVATTRHYVAAPSTLGLNPTIPAVIAALNSGGYVDDFNGSLSGYTGGGNSGGIQIENGKLVLKSQNLSGISTLAGNRAYSTTSGIAVFRAEFRASSSGGDFSVGAESSSGTTRAHMVRFVNGQIRAVVTNGSATTEVILGTYSANKTYVVQVGINGASGSFALVYEKGQSFNTALIHQQATAWSDARVRIQAGQGAGEIAYLDNLIEATQLPGLSDSDSRDRATRTVYDAAGRAIYTVDAMNGVTQNIYDAVGNRIQERRFANALGAMLPVSRATLDSVSNLPRDVGKDRITKWVFDAANRARYEIRTKSTTGSDDKVYVTETQYDRVGRVTDSIRYANEMTLATATNPTIADAAAIVTINSQLDQQEHLDFDGAGRLKKVTDALNNTQQYEYDRIGNKTKYTNQSGAAWTYGYDGAGRMLTETTQAVEVASLSTAGVLSTVNVGIIIRLVYDGLGNVKHRIENAGTPANSRVTTYQYDAVGRQTGTRDGDVVTVNGTSYGVRAKRYDVATDQVQDATLTRTVVFDALGDAIVSLDAGGRYSYKVHDRVGRVVGDIDADGYVVSYTYDAFGNQTSVKRYANEVTVGHVAGTAYSEAELQSRITTSTSDRSITNTYDLLNRKTRVMLPAVYNYSAQTGLGLIYSPLTDTNYNAFGEIQRTGQQARTSGTLNTIYDWTYYYYDRLGNRVAEIDPMGYLTEREYSATGKLTRERQWANPLASTWNTSTYIAPTATSASAATQTPSTLWQSSGISTTSYPLNQRVMFSYTMSISSTSFGTGGRWLGIGNWSGGSQAASTQGLYLYFHNDSIVPVELSGTQQFFGPRAQLLANAQYRVEFTTDPRGATVYIYKSDQARESGFVYRSDFKTNSAAMRMQAVNLTSSPITVSQYQIQSDTVADAALDTLATRDNRNVRETTYDYDALGRLITKTDIGVIKAGISIAGHVTAAVSNVATGYQYDKLDNLIRTTDANGAASLYFYDALGRQTYAVGATSTRQGPSGAITVGSLTRYYYDALGNLLAEIKSAHGSTRTTAQQGLSDLPLVYQSDATKDASTRTQYDILGRAIQLWDPEGNTSTTGYDSYGNIAKTAQSWARLDGSTGQKISIYRYNGRGLQIETRERLESGGWLSRSADYNAFGEVTQKALLGAGSGLDGVRETYRYDNAGRRIFQSGGGVATLELHDLKGNTTATLVSPGTDLLGFVTADNSITLTGLPSDVRRTEYIYDASGRMTAEKQAAFTQTTLNLQPNGLTRLLASDSLIGFDASIIPLGITPALRLRRTNTTTWLTPQIEFVNNRWRLTNTQQTALAVGEYEYQIAYTLPGESSPRAAGSGTAFLNEQGMLNYVAQRSGINVGVITINGVPHYSFTAASGSGINLSGLKAIDLARSVLPAEGNVGGLRYSVRLHTTGVYVMPVPATSNYPIAYFRPIFNSPSSYDQIYYNAQYPSPAGTPTAESGATGLINVLFRGALDIAQLQARLTQLGTGLRLKSFQYRIPGAGDEQWISRPVTGSISFQQFVLPGEFEYRIEVVGSNGTTPLNLSTVLVNGVPLSTTSGLITGTYYHPGDGIHHDATPNNQVSVTYTPQRSQTYDRWGNVLTQTDAAGVTTQYQYDAYNRQIRQILPQTFAYTSRQTAYQVTPTTYAAYDAAGNQIAVVDARGNLTTWKYDAAGLLIGMTKGSGSTESYQYNGLGWRVGEINGIGVTTANQYDRRGLATQVQNASQTVTYAYDALGNRVNDNNQITYTYDARGNVLTQTRPAVGSSQQKFTYTYDALGRKIIQTDARNVQERWTYDYFGRLIEYKAATGKGNTDDAATTTGNTITYQYDKTGQLSWEFVRTPGDDKVIASRRYRYLANGLLQQVDEAAEVPNTFLGFSTDSRTLAEYRYDKGGRLISQRTGYQNAEFQYDELGRLKVTYDGRARVEYFYDSAGNRALIRAANTPIGNNATTSPIFERLYRYSYDGENRIREAAESTVNYNAAGTATSIIKGAGTLYDYDAAGNRIREVRSTRDAEVTLGSTSALDALFGVTAYNASNVSTQILLNYYDSAGRLIVVNLGNTNGTTGSQQSYRSYDSKGRLENYYDMSGSSSTYSYSTYSYNADDTVLKKVTTGNNAAIETYSYDAAGHVTQLVRSGSSLNGTYTYRYLLTEQGYQQQQVTATSANGTKQTNNTFDHRGRLVISSRGSLGVPNSDGYARYYYDAEGRQGFRNNGTDDTGYSLYYGSNLLGGKYGSTSVEAVQTYGFTPSASDGDNVPLQNGLYVISSGDTLQSVARAVYGDARLWYLIADANSLGGSDVLSPGLVLIIPTRVESARNTADTFKPISEIAPQTLMPGLVPPPPPRAKCNAFATILVVVVAAVVTYFTAAQATPLLTSSLSPAGASIAGGAVGAAAGSAAAQGTAIALDQQAGFSWSAVATAAIGGAITSGLQVTELLQGPGIETFARGTLSNLAGQTIGVAVKLQNSFNWTQLAAAGVGSAFDAKFGSSNPVEKGLNVKSAPFSFSAVGRDTLRQLGRNIATTETQILLQGRGKLSLETVAADAFGNALGNSIVGAIQFAGEKSNLSALGQSAYDKAIANNASPQQALAAGQAADRASAGRAGALLSGDGRFNLATGEAPAGLFADPSLIPNIGPLPDVPSGAFVDGPRYYVGGDGTARIFGSYPGRDVPTPTNVAIPSGVGPNDTFDDYGNIYRYNDPTPGLGAQTASLLGGAAELLGGGLYNSAVRIGGGLASIPYLLDSVDAAAAVQQGFQDQFGYQIHSQGAFQIGSALQPFGQFLQNEVFNPLRSGSESLIGDGATTALFAGAQAGFEIAGLVAGGRALQSAFDEAIGRSLFNELRTTGFAGGGASTLDPNLLRFSQASVSYLKNREGQLPYSIEMIRQSMLSDGFVGSPLNVVRMSDGALTSLDNTRLLIARETGTPVQAHVFGADDLLPDDVVSAGIYSKRIGNTLYTPTTYGEAVQVRIMSQNRAFRSDPLGSYNRPRITFDNNLRDDRFYSQLGNPSFGY